ncbi:acetyl-CoA carboxylase biotin carboxyl carrier protein subunit [Paradesertivirga mongoliensis]|uniref:Acetyl-CoA carboxylase biotin carboxyl carrier protein subunit n=1 Tax=Paradesertivirga mongoliensis TaxID=2100740 RepID=A0ABW4ZJG2_9SPHI|nr:acetyl-CoA carboxylase biotin carboxyl carrier protein subunit [Pedobacter mongoliensis]
MYKVKVNNQHDFELGIKNGTVSYRGEELKIDYQSVDKSNAHLIYRNKSYRVEIIDHNVAEKVVVLKINSKEYKVELKDQYDELLHQLGLDKKLSSHIKDLKAPMPGLVLKLLTNEGDQVSKGDTLIILEAMKMENIIKSPVDGVIKAIKIKTGDKLEKDQVMVSFV